MIPEGEEFDTLRQMLAVLERDFPAKHKSLSEARIAKWVKEIEGGTGRNADDIRDDIVEFVIGEEAAMQRYGIDEEEFQQLILGGNEGGINFGELEGRVGEGTGIMGGGEVIKVGDKWYEIFEYPPGSGTFVSYLYDSQDQMVQVHGEIPAHTKRSEGWYEKNITVEDEIEDIIGNTGQWGEYVESITREAAELGGVTDPSLIGEMMNNEEMREILTQAALGNWSKAQIKAAQRNTSYWKDVLYQGIEEFYGKTAEPEKAWLNYRNSVQGALSELGYRKNAKGTYDDQIGEMLRKGIDAEDFLKNVPTFLRATQNAEFAKVLNQWSERLLGKTIDFDDWFDLMAGEGSVELAEVAENATLAFAAQQQGLNLKEGTIINLAGRTELSQAEAVATFANMQQTLLALGGSRITKKNMTRHNVLFAFAGAEHG